MLCQEPAPGYGAIGQCAGEGDTSWEGLNIMSALKKRTRSSLILYACSPTVLTGTAWRALSVSKEPGYWKRLMHCIQVLDTH